MIDKEASVPKSKAPRTSTANGPSGEDDDAMEE
jgi:hypothetical protein